MTQKKYIVTDDQLSAVVDAVYYRYGRPRLSPDEKIRLLDFYECFKTPYVELEPEVVKYVRWVVLDRYDNTIGAPCSSEQLAQEATCELLNAVRFIKIEGSYTK